MLRRPEPQKSSCSPCSSIASDQETKALSNKRTTVGCSCSSIGGSVVKPLRYLARREGAICFWFLPLFLVSSFIAVVDIHSVATSSHPSHHERESKRETTSHSRTVRLQRAGGHIDAKQSCWRASPAYHGYDRFSTGNCRHRCRVASGAPAAQ
jgi:hypothetical protein